MVIKLDMQIITSEFDSHWVYNSQDLVSHLSQKIRKSLPHDKLVIKYQR